MEASAIQQQQMKSKIERLDQQARQALTVNLEDPCTHGPSRKEHLSSNDSYEQQIAQLQAQSEEAYHNGANRMGSASRGISPPKRDGQSSI